MDCSCGNGIKQGTSFYLSVEFTFGDYATLNDVEQIEFIFKQKNESSAATIKSNLYLKDGSGDSHRKTDTNIILVPFSLSDTYLFEHNHKFYMDTRVYFTGSEENPPTNIVELVMSNTLFDGGDIPEPAVIPLNATENRTYVAPLGKSFNPVTVNVEIDFDELASRPKYNGTEMTSDTNIPEVPTRLSDLMDDTTHRLVTDSEKETWNAKSAVTTIKTVMDSVAVPNTNYYLGQQSAVSIIMPTDVSLGQEIIVSFSSGATPCTLICNLQGFDFVPKANKTSWLKFTYIGVDWLVESKEG